MGEPDPELDAVLAALQRVSGLGGLLAVTLRQALDEVIDGARTHGPLCRQSIGKDREDLHRHQGRNPSALCTCLATLASKGYRVLCATYNDDRQAMHAAGFTDCADGDWLSRAPP